MDYLPLGHIYVNAIKMLTLGYQVAPFCYVSEEFFVGDVSKLMHAINQYYYTEPIYKKKYHKENYEYLLFNKKRSGNIRGQFLLTDDVKKAYDNHQTFKKKFIVGLIYPSLK